MNNSPLEFLAQKYGNVVKYDADGNPSVFVKFPKMKSSELNPALPDHTHPAFIINGVEQDYTAAMEWYQKAADAGNAGAMNNIGDLYYYG